MDCTSLPVACSRAYLCLLRVFAYHGLSAVTLINDAALWGAAPADSIPPGCLCSLLPPIIYLWRREVEGRSLSVRRRSIYAERQVLTPGCTVLLPLVSSHFERRGFSTSSHLVISTFPAADSEKQEVKWIFNNNHCVTLSISAACCFSALVRSAKLHCIHCKTANRIPQWIQE